MADLENTWQLSNNFLISAICGRGPLAISFDPHLCHFPKEEEWCGEATDGRIAESVL